MTNSPLEQWYQQFVEKRDGELTMGDIATAIRQNIEIDRIVPLAIEVLQQDQLAGDKYDGELFFSLLEVNLDYWKDSPAILNRLRRHAEESLETADFNGKLVVNSWLEKVEKRMNQKSNI